MAGFFVPSGCRRPDCGLLHQQSVQGVRAAGLAKLFAQFAVAELARDPRQRPQVLRAGVLRSEEGEEQINGLVVHGLELDRMFKPYEHATHSAKGFQPRVRHGHAMSDARGAGGLALQQRVQYIARVEAEVAGRDLGDHRQGLALVSGANP